MKKIVIFVVALFSIQCCGQTQIKITNNEFVEFVNKIPAKCKLPDNLSCFRNKEQPAYVINLNEAKTYLGFSDKKYFVIESDYDMDEDVISNIRQIANPPFADAKNLKENYVELLYGYSSDIDIDNCDTVAEVLCSFNSSGKLIDSITIQGHFTRECDWIDFVFLTNTNNRFLLFYYLPNLENYNVIGGIYYIKDEQTPKTTVEIKEFQIDNNGKINLIKTYPKQYLKESVNFYRSYQKESDDPMNEY